MMLTCRLQPEITNKQTNTVTHPAPPASSACFRTEVMLVVKTLPLLTADLCVLSLESNMNLLSSFCFPLYRQPLIRAVTSQRCCSRVSSPWWWWQPRLWWCYLFNIFDWMPETVLWICGRCSSISSDVVRWNQLIRAEPRLHWLPCVDVDDAFDWQVSKPAC